jgi:hypothetical protein
MLCWSVERTRRELPQLADETSRSRSSSLPPTHSVRNLGGQSWSLGAGHGCANRSVLAMSGYTIYGTLSPPSC